MKPTLVTALLTIYAFSQINAQQSPYLRFFQQNWQFVNPAAMDRHMMRKPEKDYYITNLQVRQQWVGFEGAPITAFASWERKPKISGESSWGGPKFGFSGYFDKTDAFRTLGVQGNYSYMIQLPNSKNLFHLGINFGIQNIGLNTSEILPTLEDPTDESIVNFQNRTLIETSPGIMYRASRKYYLGLSVPQAVRAFAWKQNGESGLYGKPFQQICFIGGGYIHLSDAEYYNSTEGQDAVNETDAKFTLEPSLLLRVMPDIRYINLLGKSSPISFDANVRMYGFDKFWGGLGYSSSGNASIELGMNMKTDRNGKTGYRFGLTSSFPFLGRNPGLGTSFELFGSYFFSYPQ